MLTAGNERALIAFYEEWTTNHPQDTVGLERLADAYLTVGRQDDAEAQLRKVIDAVPGESAPRVRLAELLAARDEHAQAAEWLAAAQKIEPRNRDIIVRWGEVVATDRKQPESIRIQNADAIWRKLLDGKETDSQALFQTAELLERIDLTIDARSLAERAVDAAPDSLDGRIRTAGMLIRLNDRSAAEKLIDDWLARAPGDRERTAAAARAFHDLKTGPRAIELLTTVCRDNPTLEDRMTLVEWLSEAALYDETWSQLLELRNQAAQETASPADAPMRESIAEQRVRVARSIERLETLRQILQTEAQTGSASQRSFTLWETALTYREEGKTRESLRSVEESLEVEPQSVRNRMLAALLHRQVGSYLDAAEDYRRLAQSDLRMRSDHLIAEVECLNDAGSKDRIIPKVDEISRTARLNSSQWIRLADLMIRAGYTDRGESMLLQRFEADPGDAEVLNRLISLSVQSNQFGKAAEYGWRALEMVTQESAGESARTARVRDLITYHSKLGSLEVLQHKLDRHWRRFGLFREHKYWEALLASEAKDFGSAEAVLRQLLETDPKNVTLLEQLAETAHKRGDLVAEVDSLLMLRQIQPGALERNELVDRFASLPSDRVDDALLDRLAASLLDGKEFLDTVDDLDLRLRRREALRILKAAPSDVQSGHAGLLRRLLLAWSLGDSDETAATLNAIEGLRLTDKLEAAMASDADSPSGAGVWEPILGAHWAVETCLARRRGASVGRVRMSSVIQSEWDSQLIAYAVELAAANSAEEQQARLRRFTRDDQPATDARSRFRRKLLPWLAGQWMRGGSDARSSGEGLSPVLNRAAVQLGPVATMIGWRLAIDAKFAGEVRVAADDGDRLASLLVLWSTEHRLRQTQAGNRSTDFQLLDGDELARCESMVLQLGSYRKFAPTLTVCAILAAASSRADQAKQREYAELLGAVDFSADLELCLEYLCRIGNDDLMRSAIRQQLDRNGMNFADRLFNLLVEVSDSRKLRRVLNRSSRDNAIEDVLLSVGSLEAIGEALLEHMSSHGSFDFDRKIVRTAATRWNMTGDMEAQALKRTYSLCAPILARLAPPDRKRFTQSLSMMPAHLDAPALKEFAGLSLILAAESGIETEWIEQARKAAGANTLDVRMRAARNLLAAELCLLAGRKEDAIAFIDPLFPADSDKVMTRFQRSEWLIDLERFVDALDILRELKTQAKDEEILRLRLLVECAIGLKDEKLAESLQPSFEQLVMPTEDVVETAARYLELNWTKAAERMLLDTEHVPISNASSSRLRDMFKILQVPTEISVELDSLALARLLQKIAAVGDKEETDRVSRSIFHRKRPASVLSIRDQQWLGLIPVQTSAAPGEEQDLTRRVRPLVIGLGDANKALVFIREEAARLLQDGGSVTERLNIALLLTRHNDGQTVKQLVETIREEELSPPDMLKLAQIRLALREFDDAVRLSLVGLRRQPSLVDERVAEFLKAAGPSQVEPFLVELAGDPLLVRNLGEKSLIAVWDDLDRTQHHDLAAKLISDWSSATRLKATGIGQQLLDRLARVEAQYRYPLLRTLLVDGQLAETDLFDAKAGNKLSRIGVLLLTQPISADDIAAFNTFIRALRTAAPNSFLIAGLGVAAGESSGDKEMTTQALASMAAIPAAGDVSTKLGRDQLLAYLFQRYPSNEANRELLIALAELRLKTVNATRVTACAHPRLQLIKLFIQANDRVRLLKGVDDLLSAWEAEVRTNGNSINVSGGGWPLVGDADSFNDLRGELERAGWWFESYLLDSELERLGVGSLLADDRFWSARIKNYSLERQLELSDYALRAALVADANYGQLDRWQRSVLPRAEFRGLTKPIFGLNGPFFIPDQAKLSNIDEDLRRYSIWLRQQIPADDRIGPWTSLQLVHIALQCGDDQSALRIMSLVIERLKKLAPTPTLSRTPASDRAPLLDSDRDWINAGASLLSRLKNHPQVARRSELESALIDALKAGGSQALWVNLSLERWMRTADGEPASPTDDMQSVFDTILNAPADSELLRLAGSESARVREVMQIVLRLRSSGYKDPSFDLFIAATRTSWFRSACHQPREGEAIAGASAMGDVMIFLNLDIEFAISQYVQSLLKDWESAGPEASARCAKLADALTSILFESQASAPAIAPHRNGTRSDSSLFWPLKPLRLRVSQSAPEVSLVKSKVTSATGPKSSSELCLLDYLMAACERVQGKDRLEELAAYLDSCRKIDPLNSKLLLASGMLAVHRGQADQATDRTEQLLFLLRNPAQSEPVRKEIELLRKRLNEKLLPTPIDPQSLKFTAMLMACDGGVYNIGESRALLESQFAHAIMADDAELLKLLCERYRRAVSSAVNDSAAALLGIEQEEIARACLSLDRLELLAEGLSVFNDISPGTAVLIISEFANASRERRETLFRKHFLEPANPTIPWTASVWLPKLTVPPSHFIGPDTSQAPHVAAARSGAQGFRLFKGRYCS
ncbi:MAG: tetratricopeptide repeat protein [Pirellulales bacterium]